ncbi:MAG: histidine triad nucleotide-binding protein [Gammaproteobacteria bacterium]
MTTLFEKIIAGELPGDFVHSDDDVVAIRDINPVAPVHILVIPRKPIPTVNDLTADDEPLVGHMFTVARKLAHKEGIDASGYRLIFNCNSDGGQEVYHIHLHLIGGAPLGGMGSARRS